MDDIDPEILAIRAAQAAAVPPFDVTKMPIAEARKALDAVALLLADGKPEVAEIETFVIPESGRAARRYRPQGAPAGEAILYVHGGGWSTCGIETHDRLMRVLARETGREVIGISYRLAPEYPFPAGLEDVRAAWAWLSARTARVVVAGDSAGANLALALALAERDDGRPLPIGLALLYGCYAPGLETASRARYRDGYGLTAERMDWYWANYLGGGAPAPLSAPLTADLSGLPPAFIGIAECDILADEGRMLAGKIGEASGRAELKLWQRAVHGFLLMTRDTKIARDAASDVAAALSGFFA